MEVQSNSDTAERVGGREEVYVVSREEELVAGEGEEDLVSRGGEEEGDVELAAREGEEEDRDVEMVAGEGEEEERDVELAAREGAEQSGDEFSGFGFLQGDGTWEAIPQAEQDSSVDPTISIEGSDLKDIEYIQKKSGGKLDFSDAKKVVIARKVAKRRLTEKRYMDERKQRTDKERKALIAEMKRLTAHDEPAKGSKDFTKIENQLVLNVKEAVQKEKKNFKKVVERGGEYIEAHVKNIPVAPFNNVNDRTAAMTGVPKSSVIKFTKQYRDSTMTPKKKPGRTAVEPQDWMLSDIRTIITGFVNLLYLISLPK